MLKQKSGAPWRQAPWIKPQANLAESGPKFGLGWGSVVQGAPSCRPGHQAVRLGAVSRRSASVRSRWPCSSTCRCSAATIPIRAGC